MGIMDWLFGKKNKKSGMDSTGPELKPSPSLVKPVIRPSEDLVFNPACLKCRKPMESIRVALGDELISGSSRCPTCGEAHRYMFAQGKLTLNRVSVPKGFNGIVKQRIESSEHTPANMQATTGIHTAQGVIDLGLSIPLHSRVQYFKGIGEQLSKFSSSDIMNVVENLYAPHHPYRLVVLLTALDRNLIDNQDRFYAWSLLADDFAKLQMEKETLASALRALTFKQGSSSCVWRYIDDDFDIPWKEGRPYRVSPSVRVPERWEKLDPSAQREKLSALANELTSYIPSSSDEISNLLAKIIEIPDVTFKGWEYPCSKIKGFYTIGDKAIILADNALLCLSLDKGELLWRSLDNAMKYPSSKDVLGHENQLFVRGEEGVYCLTLDTGDIVWHYFEDSVREIMLWNNNVLAVSEESLAQLRCDNGAVEWRIPIPRIYGRKLFGDQLLCTSQTDSNGGYLLSSFDLNVQREIWRSSFKSFAAPPPVGLEGDTLFLNCGHPGSEFIALDSLTGQRKWQMNHKANGPARFVAINGPTIIIEPPFVYPEGNTVQAVNLIEGNGLWHINKFSCGDKNIVWNCGIKLDDVLVCTPEIYKGSSYVVGFRCSDGKELFSHKGRVAFLAGIGNKFFVSAGGAILAYDKAGTQIWESKAPWSGGLRAYLPGINSLWVQSWDEEKTAGKQTLTCFDVTTGTILASIDYPKPNYTEPDPLFTNESTVILWWEDRIKLLRI
jgi:outer membrane protein assembly factor BamB